MKEENEGDRGVRKSNRQRVPNAFYTEGINQLKRAPRPARDPPKPPRKRSNVYQEEAENDSPEALEDDRSELAKESADWLPCRLPKNGAVIRVQFVVQQPEEPLPVVKAEPPKPTAKKPDSAFDLLSLFQKAIENVYDEAPPEKSAEIEPQPIAKEPKLRKQASMVKPRRQEDLEGRITAVILHDDRISITHSKIGEAEFPLLRTQMDEEESLLPEDVEEYRRRIEVARVLGQISIFN